MSSDISLRATPQHLPEHSIIKSPWSGVTSCFQFVSAVSAAAKTFPSHVKTVWAKPLISGKKNGKCTGWPFHDLDPRSQLWRRLTKICLSARLSENHSSDHYKAWQLCCPSHAYYLIRFWRNSVENCYFGKKKFNFGCVFSRSNTILAISQEWLVRLMWHEKQVHWLDTGYNMSPWPLTSFMTLTLDVSRSNFEITLSPELLVWFMWNEKEVS